MGLNIAFIGTGWFTNVHAKLLAKMDGVRIGGFCGTKLEKAQRMALQYSDAKGYDNLKVMLDTCKPDAVYICVPPFAHGSIEEALIERGIPFFIEKPLDVDLETPLSMLQQIRKKRLLTSVGYHFRYMDGTGLAKERLQGARIGMALGYYMGTMPEAAWWRRQVGSGGQFIEQTTHIVDLLRYTVGEVREVYAAYAQRFMHERADNITVADVGTVTLKLADGAVAAISNTCVLPFAHQAGLHIYTEEGVLELSEKGLKEIQAHRTFESFERTNPYEAESAAFIEALRTGDAGGIRCDYAEACRTQLVTTAALQSAQSGLPVKINAEDIPELRK